MNWKSLLLTAVCVWGSVSASATGESESETPKGKAIIKVFTNFHTGFGTMNDRRGFELDRSYLGYEYNLGHGLKVKGVMDIGKSSDVGDYQRIAYVKNAQLSWKHKNLVLNAGLISTTQFNLQEKFWGARYLMKSFQDYYGFGSSADLGLSASYQINDWLAADAILVNGEGYKKVQVKDGLLYGMGVTLKPLDGLTLRVYGSINEAAKDEMKDSYNLATFIGYANDAFSIACEYNKVQHAKFLPHNNMEGISVYGRVKLSKVVKAFARYDQLYVKDEASADKEEFKLVGGVEFKIGKYIKLAPNIRYFNPTMSGAKSYCMAYINCYFGI